MAYNSFIGILRIIDEHGIIEYEFSEKLEEKLINPLMYAKLNLLISKKFKSKHALNIYMLAMDYLVLKKNYGEKILSVDELKHYLGLLDKDGNETKKYRVVDIHKHILKRAEKEINELSDINIKIESMKKANSKSISAFKFQMSIKEDHLDFYKPSLNSNHQMNLFNQLDIPGKSQRELKKEKVSIKNPALKKFFADNKISINTTMLQDKLWDIKDSLKAEFEPYLLYLTDYALTESKKGNIKNFASFFVSLLKDDSQIDNYVYYLEQKREKDEQKQIQIENMIEGKLKTQYESYLTLDFKNFLIDNIDELEETFINLFKQKIKSDTMIFNILVGRNKGIINKTLITGFNDFLRAPLIKELQNYKDEFGYIPLEFEEWKQTHINLDDIKNLKKQIECLV